MSSKKEEKEYFAGTVNIFPLLPLEKEKDH